MPHTVSAQPHLIARAALRIAVTALIAAALIATASARDARAAGPATGGTGPSTITAQPTSVTGGADPAPPPPAKKPRHKRPSTSRRKRRALPPVISGFRLGARTIFDDGAPLTVRFRVRARARQVRVRLIVRTRGGKYVRTVQLGVRRTKLLNTLALSRADLGIVRRGGYKLRLVAQDGKGRRAARSAGVPVWLPLNFATHRFPVDGQFSWGGEGSRFGAGRTGHKHQGQDLTAAEGVPVVAPHAGRISWVRFQKEGAGHYVVLDSSGEDRDYIFMHLKTGSIPVKEGDVVRTGQLLGLVGSTGVSSGPHLHFEIWTNGNWWAGGKPVDPLPILQGWYANGGGRAQALDAP